MIGPSGCGKSTFLRCLNRMNDTIPGARVTGRSCSTARTSTSRSSMWCSCAPASAWCSRSRTRSRSRSTTTSPSARASTAWSAVARELDDVVSTSLRRAGAVGRGQGPPRRSPGTGLSGGQQQRLCIARTLAVRAGSDPHGRAVLGARSDRDARIEDLIARAARAVHDRDRHALMQQAARVSQRTAYFHLGELIEVGDTDRRLHQSAASPHRGLHHRTLRLSVGAGARRELSLR